MINKTQLLTLQPVRGCNLRCRYCYLDHAKPGARMQLHTLRSLFQRLAQEDLLGPELLISWHVGEPLIAGKSFFQAAFQEAETTLGSLTLVRHSIQTNGTLLDHEWATLLADYQVNVGLSLDGPANLHDAQRGFPNGAGSHAKVMAGLDFLRNKGLLPRVICVVTRESLEHPEELHEFFLANGLRRLSFNPEETEGANTASSILEQAEDWLNGYKRFLRIFHERSLAPGRAIRIRDIENIKNWLETKKPRASGAALPLHHVSVNVNGGFSTFSPELLEASHPDFSDFILGNVHVDSIIEAMRSDKGQRLWGDIKQGLLRCRDECELFGVCGGGYPSNKLFENGSFATSKTFACEAGVRTPFELLTGVSPHRSLFLDNSS